VPVEDAAETQSVKEKFGIPETVTGKAGVEAAFQELSAFIRNGGLKEDLEKAPEKRVIKTGDWIDLEGGLQVDAYPDTEGKGGFLCTEASDDTRLIVVGINTFNQVNGNDTPHVVFHFKNIPVTRRMNPESVGNTGGYPASEMRKYLVGDDGESGKFLAGLEDAGVPKDVLWGPTRVMSTKPGEEKITDVLWLPTEREMFKGGMTGYYGPLSGKDETGDNQAGLGYYTIDNKDSSREKKFGETATWYWVASADSSSEATFCNVGITGLPGLYGAAGTCGCAPAFCGQ
jgi:hypothetical protein